MVLDDKITKTIILECLDQDALIAVRNGIFSELSNDQPAIIKLSVLADVQVNILVPFFIRIYVIVYLSYF